MPDDDNDSFHIDPLIVVSALTAVLVAGSAYLWRANMGLSISASSVAQDPDPRQSVQSTLVSVETSHGGSEKVKNPRSKERRRRGKDPLRDILKNGKKLKALSKLNLTSAELGSLNSVKSPPLSSPLHSPQQASSANLSSSSCSRSVSTSRTRGPSYDPCDVDASQPSEANTNLQLKPSLHERVPPVLIVSGTNTPPSTDSKISHISPSPTYSEPTHSFHNGDSCSPTPISDKGAPPSISISASLPAVVERPETPPIPRPSTNGCTFHSPTLQRTPTPSSRATSPPSSLTTQTQIASLRGALEAARRREAQMKLELERHAKDLESVYWERANWKRKEFELQYQVQYLAHQLQFFALSVSHMNLNPSSAVPSTSSSSRNSSSSPKTSPGGQSFQVPLPSDLQPPLNMHPLPVYYPYPPPHQPQLHGFSHLPSPLSTQMHSPSKRAANHAGLMTTFSPHSAASSSSVPFASGPSSVGSMSPEGVSPMVDRGRRKTRTSERIGVGVDTGRDDGERNVDREDGVSEVLADAILKHPGSLGLGKTWDKKSQSASVTDPDSDIAQTEFTFPSLSDFGNVKRTRTDGDNECRQEDTGTNGQYVQEKPGAEAQNGASERSHLGLSDFPDR